MKRIVFGGMFIVSLLLLQLAPAPLADQKKAPGPWKIVEDVTMLQVWSEPQLHLQWPQVTLLQVTSDQMKELENDQLAFYKKHGVFGKPGESVCTDAVAHFQVSLVNTPAKSTKSNDAVLVVAGHDYTTNCTFSALGVTKIEP